MKSNKKEYQLEVHCENCRKTVNLTLPFGHDFVASRSEWESRHFWSPIEKVEYKAGFSAGNGFVTLECPNCGSYKLFK
jgi:ribosomal protein S27E